MADPCSPRTEPAGRTQPGVQPLPTTALKWGSDGELSDLDLQRILGLLSQVDPVAEALMAHRSDPSA
jgi:hypothetical protein